jgi:glycosyltransferase involved in cell wall biosynthesis
VRICVVYDCLFPHTVGGGERWYRNLSERLARAGHEVTYLTTRQWDEGALDAPAGVEVHAVAPRMPLYTRGGRRRIGPPLVFGLGVAAHLLRHGRRYDVVHTASFPYFSLLAAGLVRRLRGFRVITVWFEVWSREYWSEYLGPAGRAGWLIQAACARLEQDAFCFSRLHAARLREVGGPEAVVLEGVYGGKLEMAEPKPAKPVVVFAGRHIPEKRVPTLVPAIALARKSVPELRCDIYGDGPERAEVERLVAQAGLGDVVQLHGFVSADEVGHALRHALCMVLPSRREGYGLVVIEAATGGTPSVVVRSPDNAATELVEDGVNGFIAESESPEELADAIVKIHDAGFAMRERTAQWFRDNATRLSLSSSLERVLTGHAQR